MDWRDIQTLEALVRTASLVGAAQELGLRHTTVSRRIDALERELGAALFLRGRRLQPTDLARAVASSASTMHIAAEEIEGLVRAARRSQTSRLTVTTNDILAPILFRAIAAADLALTVRVSVQDREEELAPGGFDLALRPTRDPKESLRGGRIGSLRIGIYRSSRDRRRAPPWILPTAALRARRSMRWMKIVPRDAVGPIECESLLAMREACLAGLGRAPLPSFVADGDERLTMDEPIERGPSVWLLAPATRRVSPALRVASGALRHALRELEQVWT